MLLGDRLTAIAESRAALVVAGVWGFAEATLFFVVPDVWLGFVALFAPRRALSAFGITLVGAVLGALVLYTLAPMLPGLPRYFDALPAISAEDLERVAASLMAEGPLAFVSSLFQGLPIKLHVHAAAVLDLPLPGVLAMVVVNRLLRVGLVTMGIAVAGHVLRAPIRRHPAITLTLYGLGVVGLYFYFWFVR